MRGAAAGCVRIALDPHQFGRTAADIEQDRAAASWVEQRRAADHRERRLGLAIDHLQPDAGLGGDAVAETLGIRGGAAGLGRDQPQPARPAVADLVAADRERGDRALDRGIADGTGRGDALAEPDDAREGIDHAEPVAGGTGDQEPAIVGAEVERRVDARSFHSPPQPTLHGPCARPTGRREAACRPSSKLSFRGPAGRRRNFRSRKL